MATTKRHTVYIVMILGFHTFMNEQTHEVTQVNDYPQVLRITKDKNLADEIKVTFADNKAWVTKKNLSDGAVLALLMEHPFTFDKKEFV